jgi:uncharacterized protein YlzI (FlbEa/FlbD family)
MLDIEHPDTRIAVLAIYKCLTVKESMDWVIEKCRISHLVDEAKQRLFEVEKELRELMTFNELEWIEVGREKVLFKRVK